jgi:hypothetical protein
MFWQDDDKKPEFSVPDNVVDLLFSIEAREIPVDHAHALSDAIKKALPEMTEDTRTHHPRGRIPERLGTSRPQPGRATRGFTPDQADAESAKGARR